MGDIGPVRQRYEVLPVPEPVIAQPERPVPDEPATERHDPAAGPER